MSEELGGGSEQPKSREYVLPSCRGMHHTSVLVLQAAPTAGCRSAESREICGQQRQPASSHCTARAMIEKSSLAASPTERWLTSSLPHGAMRDEVRNLIVMYLDDECELLVCPRVNSCHPHLRPHCTMHRSTNTFTAARGDLAYHLC